MTSEDSAGEIPQNFLKPIQGSRIVSQIAQEKLKKSQIFSDIKSTVCKVITPSREGCGFFLNEKGLIATCYHILKKDVLHTSSAGTIITLERVSVEFEGKNYSVRFPWELRIQTIFYCNIEKKIYTKNPCNNNLVGANAEDSSILYNYYGQMELLDIFLLQLDVNEFQSSFFNIKSYEDVDLVEGTSVYFAGFPDHSWPLFFHKGYVSAKCNLSSDSNEISKFTVDGIMCTGFSGGPVVIQKNNSIYLVGFIVGGLRKPERLESFVDIKSLCDMHLNKCFGGEF